MEFTGDLHSGVYLGFKTEEVTERKTGDKYTQYVLGFQRTIPNGFGGEKEVITEVVVSKDLVTKGFVTLLTPYVDTELTLPIFVSASQGGYLTRYVTQQAMAVFQKQAAA